MVIFNSYVKLPEGICKIPYSFYHNTKQNMAMDSMDLREPGCTDPGSQSQKNRWALYPAWNTNYLPVMFGSILDLASIWSTRSL